MRYFLDTEFNGFGGALISLALVPEDGSEFYVILKCPDPILPWVERNVIPHLGHVPVGLACEPLEREEASRALANYLTMDPAPEILADWPDDIAYFCGLLTTGPGMIVRVPSLRFRLLPLGGFSPSASSPVPHNALHDARALRDHVLALEP